MWRSRSARADDTPGRWARPPSRRVLLGAAASTAAAGLLGSPAAARDRGRELLCVGTWQAGTVHGAWFDAAHGTLTPIGPVAQVSANWVAAHPRRPVLYVGGGEDGGYVRAFRVDPANGATRQISEVATDAGGTDGGGVAWAGVVDAGPSGTLLVANFEAGLVASLPVGRDGALGAPRSVVHDTGSGPNPRQLGPHAHHVALDPSGRFALVADFGADRVFVYPFDRAAGTLSQGGAGGRRSYATAPGSGPRRLVFAPHGRTAYLLNELTADVQTLAWDARSGTLALRQVLPVDEPGSSETKSGAELALSRDGRFVYVSSRGTNSLVVFAVDEATGELAVVQRVPCGGTTPWGFSLHPGGRWLLVANKASGTVDVFAVDPLTGSLTGTGTSMPVPSPDGFAFLA